MKTPQIILHFFFLYVSIQAHCTCKNGTPEPDHQKFCKNSKKLFATQIDRCQKCDVGYKLSELKTCLRNECKCSNGWPVIAEKCLQHGIEACRSCQNFYHLERKEIGTSFSTSICKINQCFCENGTAEKFCYDHHTTNCASCDTNNGYYLHYKLYTEIVHLDDGTESKIRTRRPTCGLKICKCENGFSSEGVNCPRHGQMLGNCKRCKQGYRLSLDSNTENKKCLKNYCYCENGISTEYSHVRFICHEHNKIIRPESDVCRSLIMTTTIRSTTSMAVTSASTSTTILMTFGNELGSGSGSGSGEMSDGNWDMNGFSFTDFVEHD